MSQSQSPLDPYRKQIEQIEADTEGSPYPAIQEFMAAQGVPTTDRSIRRALRRWGLTEGSTQPGTQYREQGDQGSVTVTDDKPIDLGDIEGLLRDRGLNTDEWEVTGGTVNKWGNPENPSHQLKANITKRNPDIQLVAPRSDGWVAPKKAKVDTSEPTLHVIVGDQQAPFQDEQLHRLFLQWLDVNKPQYGTTLGDTVDFPNISRHQLDPENTAAVNECLQSAYDLLRGYVEASPNTRWTKIPGNHDERIRNLLFGKPKLHGLHRIQRAAAPGEQGEEVLSIPHLLRLDELGIEYIEPHGEYEQAQVKLSEHLAVRHGWIARKDAGKSAAETLKHLGFSILVGHTHRQGLVHKTTHDIDGNPTTLVAAEIGAMCRITNQLVDGRRFPSYTVAPDWQNGFATAYIWPDGKFRVDLATYVDGELLYQDQRYTA